MNLREFLAFDKAEMVTPVGLSFGIQRGKVDTYLIEAIGDQDSPLRSSERILGFSDEGLCRRALELLRPTLPPHIRIEHNYHFICDIGSAIEVITEQESDRDAIVLNCVNTLLDLIATGPFALPDDYRILLSIADHLTFREELGEFIQTRSLVRNALLWCAGAVAVDLKLVKSVTEFEPLLPSLSANPHR